MTTYQLFDSDNDLMAVFDEDGQQVSGDVDLQEIADTYDDAGLDYPQYLDRVAGSYGYVKKSDDEVQKMEDEELGRGVISKVDEERQIVFGWAYQTHDRDGKVIVDKSGEFIDDVEEIEKAAYKFVMNSRSGDFDHTNVKSSEMVESMVFTPEKVEKMGIPPGTIPSGWWVGFHFPEKSDWEEAKKRKAFSIHGKGVRKEVPD
jgi:hypothetical protein